MATAESWIKAARLRTLPLAIAGILLGCGLAWFYGRINVAVSVLAMITAVCIQVFCNFSNDYGDSLHGADNGHRIGPARSIQSGEITVEEMKTGMLVLGSVSALAGTALVYLATWHASKTGFVVFMLLGALSLLAAYFYTSGKRSYGYVGLGDLSVFVFFGLLAVLGALFLNAKHVPLAAVLPAASMGFFSTGVLNLNNMRDMENDRNSGKTTLAVRIGVANSRLYHVALIGSGWAFAVAYTALSQRSFWQWVFVPTLPFFVIDAVQVWHIRQPRGLDPYLKRLSLSTLAFVLLFCGGLVLATLS